MKTKYNIYYEVDRNDFGQPIYDLAKVFKGDKNESNAIYFIEDPKNLQQYGEMHILKRCGDDECYKWNDDERTWVKHER